MPMGRDLNNLINIAYYGIAPSLKDYGAVAKPSGKHQILLCECRNS